MPDPFDALLLARIQFAFTVALHFLFPAFTIGLASYLAVLEGLWLWTGRQVYLRLFRHWSKIFAIAFAMGVVSGIVMTYQFGTNWSGYADRTGPVIGPLMAYEVLMAFFLEAGFLGVMLFGLGKVPRWMHFSATLAVAAGTFLSAFWILAANSWMQTPAGFAVGANGQFLPQDWLAIIFSPSLPYRLLHTVTGAYLSTALVVGGVGAWHLLRDGRAGRPPAEAARIMFSMAMWMAAIVAPAQILFGDMQGLNTLEHQPAKVMAMEGHFQSHPDGAPLILFGLPDQAAQRVDFAVEIPKLSSLILKHDMDAPLAGLDTVPRDAQPPVFIVFWSFRIMVALGFLMLGLGLWSLLARARGRLHDSPWLLRFALAMSPAGLVAVIAGWVTTEVGRQPYTVYGLLRTAESLAPVGMTEVAVTLAAFVIVYLAIFGVGTFYILRLMARLPEAASALPEAEPPIRTAGIVPGPATGSHRS